MDERDLRILDRAIEYTARLADGVNPLDHRRVSPSDVVNQEKIKAYLKYVEQILKKYRYEQLNPKVIVKNSVPFSVTPAQLSCYQYSEEPLTASELCRRITDLSGDPAMKPMKAADIGAWLMKEGYITETDYKGKPAKVPTPKGTQAGIRASEACGRDGNMYVRLSFERNMQQLIIRNLYSVIGSYVRKTDQNE
ncbi:MAG: hypothetical protein IKG55_06135 [Solobacterium sp.]|nr:hypothetical protein [Solobacterium sp.]